MAIATNPKVIMTSDQFISRLKALAARRTYYKNKWPDNLCYIHSDGRTSADCSNLVKAILNGYNIYNNAIGYYQKDLSNTGDCTEIELLNQCTDVSSNFSNMGNNPRILWMNKPNGHIGVYLGQEVVIDGKKYNVIECSKGFGGITYSWVDPDGTRRRYQGDKKNCKWMKHGLPSKWVDMGEQVTPQQPSKPSVDYSKYPVLKFTKDKNGKYTTRGNYVKILQQLLVNKGYDPKGIDGVFGPGCQAAVIKFQKENTDIYNKKLEVDGCVGPLTWGSLYK